MKERKQTNKQKKQHSETNETAQSLLVPQVSFIVDILHSFLDWYFCFISFLKLFLFFYCWQHCRCPPYTPFFNLPTMAPHCGCPISLLSITKWMYFIVIWPSNSDSIRGHAKIWSYNKQRVLWEGNLSQGKR